MGNSFCQCKLICQTKREENLSSINSSRMNNNFKKSRNKLINTISSFRTSENINSIYRKNCAKKIIKNYLNYKMNKKKHKNNEIENNEYIINNDDNEEEEINERTSKKVIEPYDNLDQYSINHPFYIDKFHKSKTIYENINIPKINNGKSLEILNRNCSEPNIFYREVKLGYLKKKKFKEI